MACTLPRHLGKKYPVTEGCMLQRCFVSFQRANVGILIPRWQAAVCIPRKCREYSICHIYEPCTHFSQSIQLIYASLHHA